MKVEKICWGLIAAMYVTALTMGWVYTATFTESKPDKTETAAVGFDYIKNNNTHIQEEAERHTLYKSGNHYYRGWNNADATASYMFPILPVSETGLTTAAPASLTLVEGALMAIKPQDGVGGATQTIQTFVYDGENWVQNGSMLPYYDEVPAWSGAQAGHIIYCETRTYVWNGSDWAAVADEATAGLTSITGDDGSPASGDIVMHGVSPVTVTSASGGVYIGIEGGVGSTGFIDIQMVDGGSTYFPDAGTLGSTDQNEVSVMWFSSSRTDTIHASFEVPGNMDVSEAVTLRVWGIIEDAVAPSSSTNIRLEPVVLNDAGDSDVSGGVTRNLYTTGDAEAPWSPYPGTGSPHSYIYTFDMTLDFSAFAQGEHVTLYLYRDHDHGNDDFSHPWGLIHMKLLYNYE